jgi:hypothetical protein
MGSTSHELDVNAVVEVLHHAETNQLNLQASNTFDAADEGSESW